MEKQRLLIYSILTTFLIVAYLVYYKIYTRKTPVESEISEFIKNSEMVRLSNIKTSNFRISSYTHFFALYSYPKSRTSFLVRSEDNKYFIVLDYNHNQSPVSAASVKDRSINARVNKTEYRSMDYGTKNNPIPILYYNDAHNPDDIYIDEAQYLKNVKEYLTYDKQSKAKQP